jgi:hypothetical protein
MNSPLVSEGRRSVFLPYEKALMALAFALPSFPASSPARSVCRWRR